MQAAQPSSMWAASRPDQIPDHLGMYKMPSVYSFYTTRLPGFLNRELDPGFAVV